VAKQTVKPNTSGNFVGILVVIAVIGIAAIAYLANGKGSKAVTVDPNVPAGAAQGYLFGKADAPVQIIEFGDFECPSCGQFATVTEPDIRARLIATGQVAFTYYDFPLDMHRNTWAASNSAACANDQGKFWEMHDRLFEGQNDWNTQATKDPVKVMKGYAKEIGLDVSTWQSCVDEAKHLGRIKGNRAEALRRNIQSTPTFIIGDKMVPGAIAYDTFKAYVDSAATAATAKGAAQPSAKAPATAPATAPTTKGAAK
jgi:protein-disulfide isomerase